MWLCFRPKEEVSYVLLVGVTYGHFGSSILLQGRRNRQLCSSRRRGSSKSVSYVSEERCMGVLKRDVLLRELDHSNSGKWNYHR
jgi:hypothetical protein